MQCAELFCQLVSQIVLSFAHPINTFSHCKLYLTSILHFFSPWVKCTLERQLMLSSLKPRFTPVPFNLVSIFRGISLRTRGRPFFRSRAGKPEAKVGLALFGMCQDCATVKTFLAWGEWLPQPGAKVSKNPFIPGQCNVKSPYDYTAMLAAL